MPKIGFTIPHSLPADDAIRRLEAFSDGLQRKFADKVSDLEQSWEGNTLNFAFKTFAIQVKGAITMEEKQAVFQGEIPISAMMFKGKIESEVRGQLERLLR